MENPLITKGFCPNCGSKTNVSDKFCAQCGQSTKTSRITFGEFINDSLSSLFSMDSKIVHSIIPLLTKPGFLSDEFLKGKRQQYITPVRLYLTISILYFFILASGKKLEKIAHIFSDDTQELVQETNETSNGDNESFLVFAKNEGDSISENSGALSEDEKIDEAISDLMAEIDEDVEDKWDQYLADEAKKIAKDPNAFISYFRDKLSLFLFLTLPFFALLLKLFYYRHKLTYIEHLVFIFHTQSVLFLLLLITHFLGFISDGITWIALVLYMIYGLMALKNFYKQGWGKTILKYIIIGISFSSVALFVFAGAVVVLFLSY